jgi:hypothetical protein
VTNIHQLRFLLTPIPPRIGKVNYLLWYKRLRWRDRLNQIWIDAELLGCPIMRITDELKSRQFSVQEAVVDALQESDHVS